MIQISQLKIPCGTAQDTAFYLLEKQIRKSLKLTSLEDQRINFTWKILRHSVDARKKPDLFDVYSVGVFLGKEETKAVQAAEKRLVSKVKNRDVVFKQQITYSFPVLKSYSDTEENKRPIVIGSGPAGLFCALVLSENGYRPIVLERGFEVEKRVKNVEQFWESGDLLPDSNVQFGEGGAGTFSDGKLTTNVKDAKGRTEYILHTFVAAGANEDITYEFHPHIGTDVLRDVIPTIREKIKSLGGEVRFGAKVTDLHLSMEGNVRKVTGVTVQTGDESYILPTDCVILAPGHSARDTIRMLNEKNVPMLPKNFAVGFRVSHPQKLIDERSYGISDPAVMNKLNLEHSSYKLTAKATSGRGVYSFCMCPGGYIVNASSEPQRLAVNGMSDQARNSERANSAIVMTVGEKEFNDTLDGLYFQEELEERAYQLCGGAIPVQSFKSLKQNFEVGNDDTVIPGDLPSEEAMCIKGAFREGALHTLLPKELTEDFIEGMEAFEKQIPGFTGPDAYVCGLESRTSSPIRIPRNENLEAAMPTIEGEVSERIVHGLFPCGEGAGYAGGIMSAAIDGMKCAEAAAIFCNTIYKG